jgi:small subunit ribosomal protein S9
MPRKKIADSKKSEKKEVSPKEKYFYAVGRRKASVAQIKAYPMQNSGDHEITVNRKKFKDYFPTLLLQNIVSSPLRMAGANQKFRLIVGVRGGGFRGQAEAARLGVARAMVVFDENLRKSLRDMGFLTRDARVVERKKAGLKKARRAPQWAKR